MEDKPYPDAQSGLDLRNNRAELLQHYQQEQTASAPTPTGGGQ